MVYRSIIFVSVFVVIIALGCASGGPKPGTSGTGSAKTIESTGHPAIPSGVKCYVCHKREVPDNPYHDKFGVDCAKCHVVSIWMATKYPHEEWPLDDNHTTRCTFCHRNISAFDFSYQCWGCHHKEPETIKLHTDKGMNDIGECVACHKTLSGN